MRHPVGYQHLKVASLNIRSVFCKGTDLVEQIVEFMESNEVQILLLQEIKIRRMNQLKVIETKLKTRKYSSIFKMDKPRGVGIIYKQSLNRYLREIDFNQSNALHKRAIHIKLKAHGHWCHIINLYGFTGVAAKTKRNLWKFISKELKKIPEKDYKLLGGDMNEIADVMDTGNPKRKPSRDFISFLNSNGLVDTFRNLNPEERRYTFFKTNKKTGETQISRIDGF